MGQKITEEMLVKRFKFLQREDLDSRRPYPMFGIECGRGWFKLLWKLFEGIEKSLKKGETVYVAQIKEKFGTLRAYIDGGNELTEKLIDKAEHESEKICEDCGKKGKLRKLNGWLRTQCIKCFNGWKKREISR